MGEELSMGETRQTKKKKSRILPFLLIILILVLCGGGWWYWETQINTPTLPPPGLAAAKKKPQAKPGNSKISSPVELATVNVPEFGDLRQYSQLDAEASILKKKKEVASLQVEIAKIEGSGPKSNKSGQEMSASDIISLVNEEVGKQVAAQGVTRKRPAMEDIPVIFLSIEGVGKSISARVRELNGAPVTLKPGSRFRGGKVSSVNRNGMTVIINGKKVFYPFQ